MENIRAYISPEAAKIAFWIIIAFSLLLVFIARMKQRAEQKSGQARTLEIIQLTQLMFQYPELQDIFKEDANMDVTAKFIAIDNLDMPPADKEFVKRMLIKDLADETD